LTSFRVFIGYDPQETVAYHVLSHSILKRASRTISVSPLKIEQLPLYRERSSYQSTEFSFSRFLVPYLCGYEGYSVFMDCDMLCLSDLSKITFDPLKAVSVVKHDYIPREGNKFLDYKQSVYEKKNWSSLMVFNNPMCKTLTPDVVNKASGLYLHQFKWLQDDSLIGDLDRDWNHLVGEYPPNPKARLVHFTLGTPCFKKYSECEYAKEWFNEYNDMIYHNPIGEYKLRETGT
jgi:hypothetical protein